MNDALLNAVDDRMISLLRLILALLGLMIVYLDPSGPERLVAITYIELVLYSLYSGLLYARSLRGGRQWLDEVSHWIDLAWYVLLVSLTGGTNSVYFNFFFFAILVASFRHGYITGLRVTLVSALLFTLVVFTTEPAAFELSRFMLRPLTLLALGYMISYWGGKEMLFKRRLALLKEVTKLSNPRFGLNRTIGSIMEQIRVFHDAESCLLVTRDPDSHGFLLRRSDRSNPEGAELPTEVSGGWAVKLLSLPASFVIAFDRRPRGAGPAESFYAYDLEKGEQSAAGREVSRELARELNARSFVTVPVLNNEQGVGRMLVVSSRSSFDGSEAEFLSQLVEQAWQMVRNVELLDRLATEAASQERLKIARDLHDSPIQDYLALKFQLEALSRTITPDNPVYNHLRELAERANEYVGGLRHFVASLTRAADRGQGTLLASMRREAAKCKELFGINVEVQADSDISAPDRLTAHALQIVREGLSNIYRHTKSRQAVVAVARTDGDLVLHISNETEGATAQVEFVPRSIKERASSLGGRAEVEQEDGLTTVTVRIPL